jgi:hypothetical protein
VQQFFLRFLTLDPELGFPFQKPRYGFPSQGEVVESGAAFALHQGFVSDWIFLLSAFIEGT